MSINSHFPDLYLCKKSMRQLFFLFCFFPFLINAQPPQLASEDAVCQCIDTRFDSLDISISRSLEDFELSLILNSYLKVDGSGFRSLMERLQTIDAPPTLTDYIPENFTHQHLDIIQRCYFDAYASGAFESDGSKFQDFYRFYAQKKAEAETTSPIFPQIYLQAFEEADFQKTAVRWHALTSLFSFLVPNQGLFYWLSDEQSTPDLLVQVLVNDQQEIIIGDTLRVDAFQLRDSIIHLLLDQLQSDPPYPVTCIQLNSQPETDFSFYLAAYEALNDAFSQAHNQLAYRYFQRPYQELGHKDQQYIRELWPACILE
jgi:hypothetical protein